MAEKKVGEEFVTQHQSNEQNDERVKIVLPNEPNATIESTEQNDQTIFDRFREGRGQQAIGVFPLILLTVLEYSFSLLGLWGYQCWNWIFRILFLVISFYQVVYRMYIDFGCPNFDCHFKPNLTSDKTLHGVVATGNTVFTIVSFAALISYIIILHRFFLHCQSFRFSAGMSFRDLEKRHQQKRRVVAISSVCFNYCVVCRLGCVAVHITKGK